MKGSQRLKIVFWTLFFSGVVVFYFAVKNNPQNEHLRTIPASADNVIVIDLNELILSYKELLEEDPSQLDSLFTDFFKNTEESSFEPPAVTPFQKIAIYTLKDDLKNIDLLLVCLQAASIDGLLKLVNRYDEEITFIDQESGVIGWLKKSNIAFMKHQDVAVMVSPIAMKLSDDELDEALLINEYNAHFGSGKKLVAENAEFATILTTKNHIDYWKSSNARLMNPIGGQIVNFTNENFVRENHLKLNLEEEGLLFTTYMTFASADVLRVQEDNSPLTLNETECFKFSTSINPAMVNVLFETILPKEQQPILDNWTGRMCFAVDGFDNFSLKLVKQPSIVEGSALSKTKADTIPLNNKEILSYPLFHLACELKPDAIKSTVELIENSPSIKKEGDMYYYEIEDVLVQRIDKATKDTSYTRQRVYFYFQNNSIVFSPTPALKSDFVAEYKTFSLLFSFDNLAKIYVPRNKIDFFAMSFIPTFELDLFTMNYKSNEGGRLELDGAFTLKNKEISHLLKFPMLFMKLRQIELGEVIKGIQ